MSWQRTVLVLIASAALCSVLPGWAVAQDGDCDGGLLAEAHPEVAEQYEALEDGRQPRVSWTAAQEATLDDLRSCPGRSGRRATYYFAIARFLKDDLPQARRLVNELIAFRPTVDRETQEKGQYQKLDERLREREAEFRAWEDERAQVEEQRAEDKRKADQARRRRAEARKADEEARRRRAESESQAEADAIARAAARKRIADHQLAGASMVGAGVTVGLIGLVMNVEAYQTSYQPGVSQEDYEAGRVRNIAGLVLGFGGVAVGVGGVVTLTTPARTTRGLVLRPGPMTTLSGEF